MNLSDELLDEAQRLLYREWAIAFDNLKKVKGESDDGSPDWALFHQARLKNAAAMEVKLKRLLDEIAPLSPLTRKPA